MSRIPPSALHAAVRVLRDEFHRVDGAATGRRDGLLDRKELETIAAKGDTRELREAARLLSASADAFQALDVMGPGGGADGLLGRSALNEVLGVAPWKPPAPDRKPVELKVATWNVENLHDAFDDPDRADERATGGRIPSAASVKSKTVAIAEVLRGMSAGVVALQEVENRGMLDRLAEEIGGNRYPPSHRVFVDSGTPEGRNLALLTEYPVLRVVNHSREPLSLPAGSPYSHFKHHLLEVELNVNGQPLVVLVQHQAARADRPGSNGDPSLPFREAEADYARRVATALRSENPRRPVIVMGDLNDESRDRSVLGWSEKGAFNDVLGKVPAAQRWTNLYRPEPGVEIRRQFDHVIASAELAATARNVWVHHDARRPGVSDHAPVEATFLL